MIIDYKTVHHIPQDCRYFYGVDLLLVKRFHGPLPFLIMTAGHSSLPIQARTTLLFICIHITFLWESKGAPYGRRKYYEGILVGAVPRFWLGAAAVQVSCKKLLWAIPSSAQKYQQEFIIFLLLLWVFLPSSDLHKPTGHKFSNLSFMVKIL